MLEIIILILSVIVNSILGLAVLLNNPHKDINKRVFYLSLSMGLWAMITYLSLHPVGLAQITWVRLVLASAALQDYFVLSSFAIFPNGNFKSIRFAKPAFYYLLFVMFVTQTPLVFKALNEHSQPIVAPGILFFMTLILGYLGGAIYLLFRRYRRSSGLMKNQLRVVIFGVVTCFAAIVFTNFVLVSLFKNTSLISFAPLLTLILTGSMAYAILKHRLFDIRAAVARSLAYVLVFGSLTAVYSAGLFGVINIIFPGTDRQTIRELSSIVLIMPIILSFQAIKRYFDRLTNKLFYHNAYDSQEVLDYLGSVIVAEIDLEKILNATRDALETPLKSSFIEFILIQDRKPQLVSPKHFSDEATQADLTRHIGNQRKELIDRDELGLDNPIRKVFSEHRVSVSLRLKTHSQIVGYILFGDKKSGDIYSDQDLRLLAIVADELAIAIQNALRFEEIQKFNVTLQQKVDDATKQLRQANVRLKQLDQTKDEFISMASHQLRTPLTTIKGYLSMVLEGDVGPVTKNEKEMIQHAFDGAERMVFLIGDLLNVSRLQSGKFVIDNKPTDLAKMVDTEITQLQETAKNHHLTLTYKKPEKFPLLNIDENKIRQVLMNFIDNAIFYTPAGGSIEVALLVSDGEFRFTVTDTGLGVPKEAQHHLFSKFYRAGNARKMRPDGTGLGLFMAKKVIAAQGGAIIFNSVEGKGSTFGFSFPRAKIEVKS